MYVYTHISSYTCRVYGSLTFPSLFYPTEIQSGECCAALPRSANNNNVLAVLTNNKITEKIMGNSLLLSEAVWPYGSVVLIALGGSLIALALYFLWAGKVLTSKDQDDEQEKY